MQPKHLLLCLCLAISSQMAACAPAPAAPQPTDVAEVDEEEEESASAEAPDPVVGLATAQMMLTQTQAVQQTLIAKTPSQTSQPSRTPSSTPTSTATPTATPTIDETIAAETTLTPAATTAGSGGGVASGTASVSGTVWRDDSDGTFETGEPGIPEVIIWIGATTEPVPDCFGNESQTTKTDANGVFRFTNLAAGGYCVGVNDIILENGIIFYGQGLDGWWINPDLRELTPEQGVTLETGGTAVANFGFYYYDITPTPDE